MDARFPPADPDAMLVALVEASQDADRAEVALAEAKMRFARVATKEARIALHARADEALKLELRFQSLWSEAAARLLRPSRP